ncbi:MAG: hypothetical protein IJF13_09250 [Clostridia bacterium]|nr:hypothetical protein [Clostridia bacterium]
MKNKTFIKVLLIITAVCFLATAAHTVYAIYAYRHASIIQFAARELW